MHYSIASLFSTILGVFFNYFTIGRVVFSNKTNKHISRFFVVYGINYFINLLLLNYFDSKQVNMIIAQAIVIIPISALTYVLNKKFVFAGEN